MAFTPGPWTIYRQRVACEVDGFMAFGHGSELPLGYIHDEANAHLVAAAPDLLAALKLMLQSHDASCKGEECQLSGVDLARAAIARAEGK